MDWWQRNKDFTVWVAAGIGLFLVALIVKGCVYPVDAAALTRSIAGAKSEISRVKVPTAAIQNGITERTRELETAIARDAALMGETAKGEALTRILLGRILTRLGRGESATVDEYVRIARSSPNACFSRLYDEVKRHYKWVAVERDVPIDEDLGFLQPRFGEDEITRAFHALELVTLVVEKAVNLEGIESIEKIVVKLGRPRGREATDRSIDMDIVSITIQSEPAALYAMLTALSDAKRFIPIQDFRVGDAKATRGSKAKAISATLDLAAVRIDLEPEEES